MATLLSPADLPRSAPGRNKATAAVAGDVTGARVDGGGRGQAGQARQAKPSTLAAKKENEVSGNPQRQQGPVDFHAGCRGVADTSGEARGGAPTGEATGEADGDHDHDHDSDDTDHCHSPLTPTSPLYPAGAGSGAGNGAASTSSSLRLSSRGMGIVARSFSGNSHRQQQQQQHQHRQQQRQQQRSQQEQWQREDRAASLGDRYKGNSVFRRHQQQQQHGGSGTGNRNRNRYPPSPSPDRRGATGMGRRGVSSVAGSSHGASSSSRSRKHSTVAGAGDDVGADGRGRAKDRGKDRAWDAEGEGGSVAGEGEGEGGKGQQQGNGRVAQIAESLLWVQKHPVLAAVIWMCGKVLDPGSEATQQDSGKGKTTTATTAEEDSSSSSRMMPRRDQRGRADADADGENDAEDSSDPGMGGGLWGGSSGDFEKGRVVPPGFWKRHSKGRLSWSDDYQGGCLAEYYEDERTRMASNCSSVPPCDTDAAVPPAPPAVAATADSTSSAAAATEGAHARSASSQGAAASAAGAPRHSPKREHASSSSSSTPRDRGSAGCLGADEGAGNDGDNGDDGDEDGEVFHSALQLAEDNDLGEVTGCAALVHRDTLYGDMRDAIHGREKVGECSRKEGDLATPGDLLASQKPGDERACLELGGIGSGAPSTTPNVTNNMAAALSPGTWSPQWGWYVTMTPPQDQYPAGSEQHPVNVNLPGAKASSCTPTGAGEPSDTSSASSTTPVSIKGRPPRP
eukprot:g11432.t1